MIKRKSQTVINQYSSRMQIKSLPIDFFQRVIELEFAIKQNFSIPILQEILYLYSVKIFI